MPTTDAPSPMPWLRTPMELRQRRRQATLTRKRGRRGRVGTAVLLSAMTLTAGAAVAHERPARTQAAASTAAAALQRGDSGAAVAALQRRLNLTADGAFGPATERGLKRFQRRRGMTADGVVGPQTAAALELRLPAGSAGRRSTRSLSGASVPRRHRGTLERIARCESGGNPEAVSASGRYRGKYQFSRTTWRSVGGTGDPAAASETEQDRRAAALLAREGTAPWPNCA